MTQSLTFHAVDYTSAINYTYDSGLVTGVAWSGPVAGTVNAGYDDFFRVNVLSVNGGSAVGFGYDADGLLVQAGDLALTRDPQNGRLAGTTLGNVSDAWAYTGFGEAQSYTATAGGSVLYAMSFTRDNAGRITTKTETIGGVTSVYGYGYDPVRGWLTDVTKNGTAAGHYAYDDNGNRTSVVTPDRAVDYAAADGQDRIASATLTLPLQVPQTVNWTYSANGEVQSKTVGASMTSYSYDVLGTLRDVTLAGGVRIAYVVDAAGRRIGKAVNGSLTRGWLYQDGLKPAAELDGAGNVVSLFVYGGKANVPEYLVRGGNEYRLITDQLGSVRLVVNAGDGTVAQELDYDEFGRVLSDSNPGFQPFGYAGGLYDPDTKLVRFGARDYDAASGRWMSKDPIGFNGGNNWYAYVGNDPISRVDPLGLSDALTPGQITQLRAEVQAAELTVQELLSRVQAEQENLQAIEKLQASNPGEYCSRLWLASNDALQKAQNSLRDAQSNYRDLLSRYSAAVAAASSAAAGLYATATEVFTAPTVGASFTGSGVTGGAIAGGAVVGAAALGAGIGYGASQIPVIGGGNVADFWGDVLYNACPSCFR